MRAGMNSVLARAVFAAVLATPFALGLPSVRADDAKDAKPNAAAETKPAPAKPKIAVFRLSGAVTETPAEESLRFDNLASVSLHDVVERMGKAAKDPDVKAVVVLHEAGVIGAGQVEELRHAMARVRDAGKEVYANADSISMRDYVLLSGASNLSVVPTADVWIMGLYGESPYLRGLLDKLGVKPDFLTCGAYKSAAEIFMREGPSPEAEAMQNWLLDGMFDAAVRQIARGRGVAPAKVRTWVDGGPYTAEKAKAAGIVDAVEHRQEFEAHLKSKFGSDVVFDKKYGRKEPPKIDFSSPFGMFKLWAELLGQTQKKPAAKDTVGLVYVEGPITLGSGQPSLFSTTEARSSKVRKALDEAARDSSVKAVVLRVNSPGGSAVASEIILDATRRVKAKKPFTVSMGDVAGSGGYYVACASDLIFADESTITASIGVVGGKLATSSMWDKAGIRFKSYKRGENAGILSGAEMFTPQERERMQTWMDEIYAVFKSHVRSIRGDRLKKPLDELAGGRVFTGKQALELGLIDRIGSLQDAIAHVAQEAKLTDYQVRAIPAPKTFLEQLVEESSGTDDAAPGVDLGRVIGRRGDGASLVQLAMPYLRHLDPQRVAAVRLALERLQLLQEEGVVLMMPEIAFPR